MTKWRNTVVVWWANERSMKSDLKMESQYVSFWLICAHSILKHVVPKDKSRDFGGMLELFSKAALFPQGYWAALIAGDQSVSHLLVVFQELNFWACTAGLGYTGCSRMVHKDDTCVFCIFESSSVTSAPLFRGSATPLHAYGWATMLGTWCHFCHYTQITLGGTLLRPQR